MNVTIDRFEGDFAIVLFEDGTSCSVARKLFADAKEGDVFSIRKDTQKTDAQRKKAKALVDSLFHD